MRIFALLALSLLWGSTFLWTKILLVDFHPFAIVFYRCLFGLIMLLPIIFMKGLQKQLKPTKSLIFTAALGAAIPWTLMTYSQHYLDTTISGIINALSPILTIILSVLLFKKQANFSEWISVGIGFSGMMMIFLFQQHFEASNQIVGTVILLCAAACYSLTSLLTDKYHQAVSPYILAVWTLTIAVVICGLLAFIVQPDHIVHVLSPVHLLIFVIFGMLSSGIGYVLFYYLVHEGDPVFAVFVTFLMPCVTFLLGSVILDEVITWNMGAGLVLVLTSIMFLTKGKQKRSWKHVKKHYQKSI